MIFWPHNDDLSKPPELSDLRYRRPTNGKYWESRCANKPDALHNLWVIWKRETGLPYPRALPRQPRYDQSFGIVNRISGNNRPKHQNEKGAQDA